MSDLTEAIDAFLAKYPPNAHMEWRTPPRRPHDVIRTWADDLTESAQRHAKNNPQDSSQ